jgi:hypothetical protein
MNNINSLEEISPNVWRAKYQGNYGVYTINITLAGDKTTRFSCSCPSDYYPCKHIAIVEQAIAGRMKECRKPVKENEITVERLLKDVPQKELCDFLVRQARYNPELTNTLLLEFSHKINAVSGEEENSYSPIMRKALESIDIDDEDLYDYDGCVEIDALDQWEVKAQTLAAKGNYREAVLICKAIIEEYANWLDEYIDMIDCISADYQTAPFEILNTVIANSGVDAKALFDYCRAEMKKPKYSGTEMLDGFNDLLMTLSAIISPDSFIDLQDELLSEVKDKSSYEARKILERKVNFYTRANQPEKAWEVIEANIQIMDYREKVVKKRIEERRFTEAKKLIKDFIGGNGGGHTGYWHEFLLDIAKKEKDTPAIREISFAFIKNRFDKKHFQTYKSTFTRDEWQKEMEALIKTYEKSSHGFNDSVAEVLKAEGATERLLAYAEKHPSLRVIEEYHTAFAAPFPEKTLALFRQAVDNYAENTGRECYAYVLKMLKKMRMIKGGEAIVSDMVSQYKIRYKNRRAMLEILNRL